MLAAGQPPVVYRLTPAARSLIKKPLDTRVRLYNPYPPHHHMLCDSTAPWVQAWLLAEVHCDWSFVSSHSHASQNMKLYVRLQSLQQCVLVHSCVVFKWCI